MSWKRRIMNAGRAHARRRGPLARIAAAFAREYVEAFDNQDHDMARNGEVALLASLGRYWANRSPLLFDTGANQGDWTEAALKAMPRALVHAFEIAPPTAERLQAHFAGDARVKVHPYGLGEHAANTLVHFFDVNDMLTSRFDVSELHGTPARDMPAEIRAGAAVCAEAGITAIDLLKIDTEGSEDAVLDGLQPMIAARKIAVVQFEYGMGNIYSRHLLADHHARFEASGYVVGKLYPSGVAFAPYHPTQEDFRGPYHVAVAPGDDGLRRALEQFTA
jgi:FkbM family methyltransferase